MRTAVNHYGYYPGYDDASKQSCWNIYLYTGGEIYGTIYLENGVYYAASSGNTLADYGTYLITPAGIYYTWDNIYNEYLVLQEVTTTTTTTTITQPPRTEIPYLGFGETKSASFSSGITGSIWLDNNGYYYTTSGGLVLAQQGWYLIDIVTTWEDSNFIYANAEEPTTTTITTEPPPEGMVLFDALIYLKTGTEYVTVKGKIWAEFVEIPGLTTTYRCDINKQFISYPDSRAYKMDVMYFKPGVELYYTGSISLSPSRSYNYSFAIGSNNNNIRIILNEGFYNMVERLSYRETDVVIASAVSNPFFFPVEQSYRIGGNIKALALMSEQITDSQVGRYPLVILTDKGIFSLEQGETVLYSNVIPINSDICEGSFAQTKVGICYIANGQVNLLNGRDGIPISLAIEGQPDLTIRQSQVFENTINNNALYLGLAFLSSTNFKTYAVGSRLFYEPDREEIICSNINFPYSYVYSIRTQLWHKITALFVDSSGGYAVEKAGFDYNLVELKKEDAEDTIIHLQTRPFLLRSFGYKSIYRAIMRGQIDPATNKVYGAYLYASNNLKDWNLVSASQTNIFITTLRLIKARLSYRYFIFASGGVVKPSFTLSVIDFITDDKYINKDR